MQDVLIVCLCIGPLVVRAMIARWIALELRTCASVGLAMAFAYFALGHFVVTNDLAAMLPAWFPHRVLLVYLTGIPEIVIALALLNERSRRWAGLGAALLLVLFFPVNVYAAVNHLGPDGAQGVSYLWIRAPLQAFLIAWTLWPIGSGKVRP
jgi:uncharacterized membrane protein